MFCSIQVWCFCLSLCWVWFAAITYVVDLAQAQEREEFFTEGGGTIVWTRVMNSVFILICLWIGVFV